MTILRKACRMAMETRASYRIAFHERQFEVFTDASLKYAGISDKNAEFQKTLRYEGYHYERFDWPEKPNINLLEMWAVFRAIQLAPTKCTLRVVTDNKTALKMFKRTGDYQSYSARIVEAAQRLAISKDISVDMAWICTDH
jgi:precorrin-6x reductase